MAVEIVKGNSVKFSCVVKDNNGVVIDLTSATLKLVVKKNDSDLDSAALVNKNGSIITANAGTCEVVLTAAESNALPYDNVVYELIVKLADGSYIRTGSDRITLRANVLKTLF